MYECRQFLHKWPFTINTIISIYLLPGIYSPFPCWNTTYFHWPLDPIPCWILFHSVWALAFSLLETPVFVVGFLHVDFFPTTSQFHINQIEKVHSYLPLAAYLALLFVNGYTILAKLYVPQVAVVTWLLAVSNFWKA